MSKYDLLYLSNHVDFKKVKTNVCDQNLTEDIKFYEERIMQQTKILLYNISYLDCILFSNSSKSSNVVKVQNSLLFKSAIFNLVNS